MNERITDNFLTAKPISDLRECNQYHIHLQYLKHTYSYRHTTHKCKKSGFGVTRIFRLAQVQVEGCILNVYVNVLHHTEKVVSVQ